MFFDRKLAERINKKRENVAQKLERKKKIRELRGRRTFGGGGGLMVGIWVGKS
jgi:hypothetical protein